MTALLLLRTWCRQRFLLTEQLDGNAELCGGQDEQFAPGLFEEDRLVTERQLEERRHALGPANTQQQQARRPVLQTTCQHHEILHY